MLLYQKPPAKWPKKKKYMTTLLMVLIPLVLSFFIFSLGTSSHSHNSNWEVHTLFLILTFPWPLDSFQTAQSILLPWSATGIWNSASIKWSVLIPSFWPPPPNQPLFYKPSLSGLTVFQALCVKAENFRASLVLFYITTHHIQFITGFCWLPCKTLQHTTFILSSFSIISKTWLHLLKKCYNDLLKI